MLGVGCLDSDSSARQVGPQNAIITTSNYVCGILHPPLPPESKAEMVMHVLSLPLPTTAVFFTVNKGKGKVSVKRGERREEEVKRLSIHVYINLTSLVSLYYRLLVPSQNCDDHQIVRLSSMMSIHTAFPAQLLLPIDEFVRQYHPRDKHVVRGIVFLRLRHMTGSVPRLTPPDTVFDGLLLLSKWFPAVTKARLAIA